jgi:hypothetical protein
MNAEGNQTPDNSPQLHYAIIGAGEVLGRWSSMQWKLPAEKWPGFDDWMTTLASSLASGDAGAIEQAAAELARMEPRRIVKLGSAEATVPMPEQTRERLNEVVHVIDRLRSGAAGPVGETNPPPGSEPDRP